MIRAITFDFWGTMYQGKSGREARLHLIQEWLVQHAAPRRWEDLEQAYQHILSLWEQAWREQHRSLETLHWLREMMSFLQVDLPDTALHPLCAPVEEVFLHTESPRPIPGVTTVLPRLAQRYRLGIISDTGLTPGRVLRTILQRDGLLDLFHVTTYSDETGETKPLPGPFRRTLEALGTPPERAVHVGDLPETDIVGAKGIGMKAILFLGVSQRHDGRKLADATFESYDQLETLLEQRKWV